MLYGRNRDIIILMNTLSNCISNSTRDNLTVIGVILINISLSGWSEPKMGTDELSNQTQAYSSTCRNQLRCQRDATASILSPPNSFADDTNSLSQSCLLLSSFAFGQHSIPEADDICSMTNISIIGDTFILPPTTTIPKHPLTIRGNVTFRDRINRKNTQNVNSDEERPRRGIDPEHCGSRCIMHSTRSENIVSVHVSTHCETSSQADHGTTGHDRKRARMQSSSIAMSIDDEWGSQEVECLSVCTSELSPAIESTSSHTPPILATASILGNSLMTTPHGTTTDIQSFTSNTAVTCISPKVFLSDVTGLPTSDRMVNIVEDKQEEGSLKEQHLNSINNYFQNVLLCQSVDASNNTTPKKDNIKRHNPADAHQLLHRYVQQHTELDHDRTYNISADLSELLADISKVIEREQFAVNGWSEMSHSTTLKRLQQLIASQRSFDDLKSYLSTGTTQTVSVQFLVPKLTACIAYCLSVVRFRIDVIAFLTTNRF